MANLPLGLARQPTPRILASAGCSGTCPPSGRPASAAGLLRGLAAFLVGSRRVVLGTLGAVAIYEINEEHLTPLDATSFEAAGVLERAHLQRMLRDQISVIAPEALVISEEFCEWDESKRRIDLLGVDRDANLVVIELKRTDDGGHMELQALRYAAMVSTMTFDRAAEVFADHLKRLGTEGDARAQLLAHLGWDEPNEDKFAGDVRVVLASADFSKELTTAVLWLNGRDLDIRCVRLKPYRHGDRVLLDVQQVIPLPEAEEYQVRVREKEQQARQDRAERHDLRRRFWEQLLPRARQRTQLHANISPSDDNWIWASAGIPGLSWMYSVKQHEAGVSLYIDFPDAAANKAAIAKLMQEKDSIEASFGSPLDWWPLPDRRCSIVSSGIKGAGYRTPEEGWPKLHEEMVSAMIKLESTLGPRLQGLRPMSPG